MPTALVWLLRADVGVVLVEHVHDVEHVEDRRPRLRGLQEDRVLVLGGERRVLTEEPAEDAHGDFGSRRALRFQTTSSAVNSRPLWYVTPLRRLSGDLS